MDPLRQRERALRRLSTLTTSAGVAGVLATVGFGGLAAATYRGQTTTDGSGQSVLTPYYDPQPSPTPYTSGTRRRQTTTTVTPPVLSFGGGHITSGGSR